MVIKSLIRFIDKFVTLGDRILVKLGAFAMLVIIVSISLGVVMRKVFNSPLIWPEELSGFLFVWVAFFGAGVASARKKHVYVDIISKKMNQTWHQFLAHLMILIFLAIVVFGGGRLQLSTSSHSSGVLGITRNYYYLPLLIVSIYMFILHMGEMLRTLLKASGTDIGKGGKQ
jgi:TRAP-type C4-dicarboxylate transport system permease small subunit